MCINNELERKRNLISDVVCDLAYKYVEEYGYENERDINSGDCEIFADDLIESICYKDDSIEVTKMSTCDFTYNGVISYDDCIFDKSKLEKFFGYEFSDELVDKLSSFNLGYHVWICYEGKHYDCESVDGVDNPFELEFFERTLSYYLATENYNESSFEYLKDKYSLSTCK